MPGTMTATVRGGRSRLAGFVFLGANVVVSVVIGAAVGALGTLVPRSASFGLAVAIALVYVGSFVVRARVPFLPWPPQLPATWIDRGHPSRTAARYGTVWGLTFATPVRAGSLFALAALVAGGRSPTLGALLFGLVAVIRALPTALTPFRPPRDPDLGPWRQSPWPRTLVGVLDALVLTVLVAVLAQTALAF